MPSPTHTSHDHPFLRAMVPEHRSIVLQGAEEQTFAPGEILFREGQPANRLYLIHRGQVGLETHVPGTGDVMIAPIAAGQVLGWSWLVAPFVWHFQGRALESVQASVLNGGHLLVASERNHFLGYELMKGISKVILDALLVAHQRWLDTGHYPVPAAEASSPIPGGDPNRPLPERIADHPFFHGMRPEYLDALTRLAMVKEFEPGQIVFRTGEQADGLYVIERGRLLAETPTNGGSTPVQVIRAGEAVGWSAFCPPYEWHFDGCAMDLTSTIFFKAADLRERWAADYHLGYDMNKRITRMMLQHLQSTRQRMWEAFRSGKVPLAATG